MKCNHAHECNSTECWHREDHEKTSFCASGYCRWAWDTKCVPESTRELVEELIRGNELTTLSEAELVDRIMAIFENKEEAV